MSNWSSRSQYRRFLDVLSDNFEVMPVKDYEKSSKRKKCLLRHDIDQGGTKGLSGALMMAEVESCAGIHSTYYFLHTARYYSNRERVIKKCKKLQGMGHEVGFHNNIITACIKNSQLNPKQVLESELDFLRKNGIEIHGTAAHGTALCRKLGYANYQIFKGCEAWNEKYRLKSKIENVQLHTLNLDDYQLYEAYFIPDLDYYLTDSGGVWKLLKVPPSQSFFENTSKHEITDFVDCIKKLSKDSEVELIEILTHPGTWVREHYDFFRQRYKYETRRPERLEWIREMNERPQKPPQIEIGEVVEIHPTVKLGEVGVSMERDESGAWVRCKQHGDISIGDHVRIGPFCNIKRATMPRTTTSIGEDSELCTYVNVGHNCKIGKHVFIGPHVCLNGSVTIGDGAWIAAHVVIEQHAHIGPGAVVGMGAVVTASRTGGWDVPPGETVVGIPAVPIRFAGNHIHPSFEYGWNLKIGKDNHIHEGVTVGDNVKIMSYVELRRGTVIGDECYLDSGVKSSGQNWVGDRVTLRYDSILAKGVIIEPDVFVSPQFMTENVNHKGEEVGGAHIGTGEWNRKTKYRVFIGTDVTLAAGIEICSGAIIGSKANVRKSITSPGVYVGNPARRLK